MKKRKRSRVVSESSSDSPPPAVLAVVPARFKFPSHFTKEMREMYVNRNNLKPTSFADFEADYAICKFDLFY
jgi:hypothetical protein